LSLTGGRDEDFSLQFQKDVPQRMTALYFLIYNFSPLRCSHLGASCHCFKPAIPEIASPHVGSSGLDTNSSLGQLCPKQGFFLGCPQAVSSFLNGSLPSNLGGFLYNIPPIR